MTVSTVVVLMGGPDAEREVSIQSGTAVATALEQTGKYFVHQQLIDTPSFEDIERLEADVVFPVLHGPFGEGGPLQDLLESADIPFVGSTSFAASLAMDKVASKQVAQNLEIQTPQWCVVSEHSNCSIDPPLVLKPINDGSSYGVHICHSEQEVFTHQESLLNERQQILAESYVKGRELTVGIIGGKVLPIVEIIVANNQHTYDFEAKYKCHETQYIVEPSLPSNTCTESALAIYEAMGIRDIARVDFLLDDLGVWFLELNTMPGFTDHSLVPLAAKHAGMEMPELCSSLVEFALRR